MPVHIGKVNIRPEDVGYDSRKLDALNQFYANLIDNGTIQAASYLISRKGQVFARNSLGKLRPSEERDLLPESIRKVYSITKAFTAVAITQLIDKGLIYLHQSVSSILPEFDTDKHRGITIFHLLTHTSGLRGDPGFYTEPYTFPWFEWLAYEKLKRDGQVNWIKTILDGPLQRKPNKEWIYCTSGYTILGEIIAKISGKSYEQYINDHIISPLNMDSTFITVPEARKDEVCCTTEWELQDLYSPHQIDVDVERPPLAGNGLYSTLDDLWKLGQMMLNKGQLNGQKIVSSRAVSLQTSNHLHQVSHLGWGNDNKNFRYGLGWSLDHQDICSVGTFSHEGYGHCGLYVDPNEELVFVFFVPSAKGYSHASVVNPRAIVWSGIQ